VLKSCRSTKMWAIFGPPCINHHQSPAVHSYDCDTYWYLQLSLLSCVIVFLCFIFFYFSTTQLVNEDFHDRLNWVFLRLTRRRTELVAARTFRLGTWDAECGWSAVSTVHIRPARWVGRWTRCDEHLRLSSRVDDDAAWRQFFTVTVHLNINRLLMTENLTL